MSDVCDPQIGDKVKWVPCIGSCRICVVPQESLWFDGIALRVISRRYDTDGLLCGIETWEDPDPENFHVDDTFNTQHETGTVYARHLIPWV